MKAGAVNHYLHTGGEKSDRASRAIEARSGEGANKPDTSLPRWLRGSQMTIQVMMIDVS
jgi:hypothetical protein